jgi:hypothetical protein
MIKENLDGLEAIKYIHEQNIQGALVECGVQSGKHQQIWLSFLNQVNSTSREIWLYDTFAGLTAPGSKDFSSSQSSTSYTPSQLFENWKMYQNGNINTWCYAPLEEVKNNLQQFNYPHDMIKYVVGDVIETLKINDNIPNRIALLRLDTDWYESTKSEMEALFPRLETGGVLILDDYFWWEGQRQAVDEYLQANKLFYDIKKTGTHTAFLVK